MYFVRKKIAQNSDLSMFLINFACKKLNNQKKHSKSQQVLTFER